MGVSISSIIIGARLMPTFQMVENAGSIFDKLLKDTKNFPRSMYSSVSFSEFDKTLYEEDKKNGPVNYVKIATDNVIFGQRVEKGCTVKDALELQRKKYEGSIVPITLDAYSSAINRIGVVFVADITEDKLKEFKERHFVKGNDIAEFRFSKSTGTWDGIILKDKTDYANRIYSLSRKQDGSKQLSFDYQRYFYPLRPNWLDCKASVVFEEALKAVSEDILTL